MFMTQKDFKARLEDGGYKDAGGARKGVGKMQGWSAAEKDKARALINKHFGVEDAAPVKSSKAAAGQKRVAKKAQKRVAKKAERLPVAVSSLVPTPVASEPVAAAAPAVQVKRRGRRPAVPVEAGAAPVATKGKRLLPSDDLLRRINIIGEIVGTAANALASMEKCKLHGVDITKGSTAAQGVFTSSVQELGQLVHGGGNGVDPVVATAFAQAAPASLGLPGHQSPVQVPAEYKSSPASLPPDPQN